MELLRQPEGSHLCGQTCVAMITGCTLAQATLLTSEGRTGTKHLVAALRILGCTFPNGTQLKRTSVGLPRGTSIGRVSKRGVWATHWVVIHQGQVLDPAFGLNPRRPAGWRITSYLRVDRRDDG